MTLAYKYNQEHMRRLISVMPEYLIAWKVYIFSSGKGETGFFSPFQGERIVEYGWQRRKVYKPIAKMSFQGGGRVEACCMLAATEIPRHEKYDVYRFYPQGFHCFTKRGSSEFIVKRNKYSLLKGGRNLPVIVRRKDILVMGFGGYGSEVVVARSIFFHPKLDASLYNPADNVKFEHYLAETWPGDFPELIVKESHGRRECVYSAYLDSIKSNERPKGSKEIV